MKKKDNIRQILKEDVKLNLNVNTLIDHDELLMTMNQKHNEIVEMKPVTQRKEENFDYDVVKSIIYDDLIINYAHKSKCIVSVILK